VTFIYKNNDNADIAKKSAATTNVSLNTNFSTPRLVNEDEFDDLEKPVPRTWRSTKIIRSIALMDWITCTVTFMLIVYLKSSIKAN
jgi:hypothetical protein